MLTSEARRNGSLFERIVDCVWWPKELFKNNVHAAKHFGQEEVFAGFIERGFFAFIPTFFARETEALGWWTCWCCEALCGGREGGDSGGDCASGENTG